MAAVTVVVYIMIFMAGALVFSFVKGKIFIKGKLPPKYRLTEALGGFSAVFSVYWFWRSGEGGGRAMLQAVLVFALLVILAAISFIDMDRMKIPDSLVISVLICGGLDAALVTEPGVAGRLAGGLAVSLPMGLLALFIAGAFGGGDIKLMFAAGIFLGWRGVLAAFLIAVLAGGVYSVYLLVLQKKDRKGKFAFGPFLCFGIAVSVFAGEAVISWYSGGML